MARGSASAYSLSKQWEDCTFEWSRDRKRSRSSFQLFISPQSQLMLRFRLLFSTCIQWSMEKVRINKPNPFLWSKTLFEHRTHSSFLGQVAENPPGFILTFYSSSSSDPSCVLAFNYDELSCRAYQDSQTINFIFVIIISPPLLLEKNAKVSEAWESEIWMDIVCEFFHQAPGMNRSWGDLLRFGFYLNTDGIKGWIIHEFIWANKMNRTKLESFEFWLRVGTELTWSVSGLLTA